MGYIAGRRIGSALIQIDRSALHKPRGIPCLEPLGTKAFAKPTA